VHTACAATALRPPASRPASRPALHPLLSTRQFASVFNQPLSFDTSSVTNMYVMFGVRSARALPPPPPAFGRAPCMPYPPPHTLSPPGTRTSPPIVRAPFPTLGRRHTPCPPPTSSSSVARGRTLRPLTAVLARSMASGLRRKAAPRDNRLHLCERDPGWAGWAGMGRPWSSTFVGISPSTPTLPHSRFRPRESWRAPHPPGSRG